MVDIDSRGSKKANLRAQDIIEKFVVELLNPCNRIDVRHIGEFCVRFLCESLQLQRACLLIRFAGRGSYTPCGHYGVGPGKKLEILEVAESDPFVSEINDHDDLYLWRQIPGITIVENRSGSRNTFFNFTDFPAVLPLKNGEKLVGILFIGAKTSGAEISRTEARIIKVIAAITIIYLISTSSMRKIEGSSDKKQFAGIDNLEMFQSSLGAIRQYLHEINNSLTGVLARIDLIRAEPLNETARRQLDKLEESALRTSSLLQDLHGFVRRVMLSPGIEDKRTPEEP